jgi:hypothetical protein
MDSTVQVKNHLLSLTTHGERAQLYRFYREIKILGGGILGVVVPQLSEEQSPTLPTKPSAKMRRKLDLDFGRAK